MPKPTSDSIQRIALIAPTSAGSAYVDGLQRGFLDACRRESSCQRYAPLLLPSRYEHRASLAGHDLAGIVAHVFDEVVFADIAAIDRPLICADDYHPERDLVRVQVDDHAIGPAIAEHLIEQGYQQFAAVRPPFSAPFIENRLSGFQQRLATAGHSVQVFDRFHFQPDAGELRELQGWMSGLPSRTGILAITDGVANAVIRSAHALRRAMPRDLGVVGVDNSPFETRNAPLPVSTVPVPAYSIGYRAARKLATWIQTDRRPPSETIAPERLICRQSSAGAACEDAELDAALQLVRADVRRHTDVASWSRAAGMNRRRLERLCRRHFARPPHRILSEIRLHEAHRMICDTGLSRKQIAADLGFASTSHMNLAARRLGWSKLGFQHPTGLD